MVSEAATIIETPYFKVAEVEGLRPEPQPLGKELKFLQTHRILIDGRKKSSQLSKLVIEF